MDIDLSKAFDTVDPFLLTDKRVSTGLDQNACHWFMNCFTERTQCSLNHTDSTCFTILKVYHRVQVWAPHFSLLILMTLSHLTVAVRHIHWGKPYLFILPLNKSNNYRVQTCLNVSKAKYVQFSRSYYLENKLEIYLNFFCRMGLRQKDCPLCSYWKKILL